MQARKTYQQPDVFHVGHNRCIPAVAPDDSAILVGAASGLLLLFNMATGAIESKLSCHTSAVTATAWNAQSLDSGVVAASCDRAGALVFWKCANESAQDT